MQPGRNTELVAGGVVFAALAFLFLLPAPPPLAKPVPRPSPAPAPAPDPQPLPKPKPRPRPWDTTAQLPVGSSAKVGPVAPDGTEPSCDLPSSLQKKNIGGSDGAGLCVFTSCMHAARYQDIPVLMDFQKYMHQFPGGGYPSKLAKFIKKKAQHDGVPEPRYIQVTDANLELLKLACKTNRMPCVTYSRSPTGRYSGGHISHMVNIASADDKWIAVLDNNYIGQHNLEWMTPETYQKVGSPIWAVIFLDPGPPPAPHNRQPERQELLARNPFALPGERLGDSPMPTPPLRRKYEGPRPLGPLHPVGGGNYEWRDLGHQLALFYDGKQIGNYRLADGLYYSYCGKGQGRDCWEDSPSEPPIAPPAWAVRTPNYGVGGNPVDDEKQQAWQELHEKAFYFQGKKVTKNECYELFGDQLADDSKALRLTVIGTKEACDQVVKDAQTHPAFAGFKGRLIAHGYRPGSWQVANVGYVQEGSPAITLTDAEGVVLWRQTDYAGPDDLAQKLRKADPHYRPELDPNPSNPTIPGVGSVPPEGIVAGLLGSTILGLAFLRRRVA